jgi:hypothetical protein
MMADVARLAGGASGTRSPALSAARCSGQGPAVAGRPGLSARPVARLPARHRGLDLTASEAALRATFDDARRRTAELGEKARQATHRGGGDAGAATGARPAVRWGAAAGRLRRSTTRHRRTARRRIRRDRRRVRPRRRTDDDRPTQRDAPSGDPDIELPFDGRRRRAAVPSYAAPPAWTPPPAAPAPSVAPLPAAAPLPAPTTCAQCLSPVSPDDCLLRRVRLPLEVRDRALQLIAFDRRLVGGCDEELADVDRSKR